MLPAVFAQTIRELYVSGDPTFAPTMKAAHDKGWSYTLLGDALELTYAGARHNALKKSQHAPVTQIPEPTPGPTKERDERPRLTPEQAAHLRVLYESACELTRKNLAKKATAEDEFNDGLVESWVRGVRAESLADDLGFEPDLIMRRVFHRARTRIGDFTEHPARAKMPRGRSVHAVGYAHRRDYLQLPPYVITACDQFGGVGAFLPDDAPVTCTACRRTTEQSGPRL